MDTAASPTRYRVVVRGRMSERMAFGFEGLEVEPGPGVTALTGAFVDQAQLYGVIDRLRDLGIELVSVNALR
jgi:hypothetical protein